jgi:hypothetical protein
MHHFNARLVGESGALVEAQVVQAHLGTSLSETLKEIYELNLEGRLRAEMLVIRLPVEENWDPAHLEAPNTDEAYCLLGNTPTERDLVFARARDRSVHLLGSHNGQHFITSNLSPHWSADPFSAYGLTPNGVIAAVRVAEMEHILESSRAILTLHRGGQFIAPSRRLVRSFIRVGHIQYDRDAIDAISFWLLPHLHDVGTILTDTWSISSIALNVSRLCAAYFGGAPPRVELLPSYNDGSELARQKSRRVIERLERDFLASGLPGQVMLCLISATQTGSLADRLNEIFSESGMALKPRFATLFRLGASSIPTLHDLSQDARFDLIPDVGDSDESIKSAPIKIDPQIYFPLTFQDTQIALNKRAADHCRMFFERYIGSGLIQVHRDHEEQTGRPQHHGIHLATEVLLNVSAFKSAFQAKLAALPTPPIFIVSPPHDAGRALAKHAASFFAARGQHCDVFAHPHLLIPDEPLRKDEQRLRALLCAATEDHSILIIDDVCITGTRLSQYQRYIRTEHYKGRIDYLVGIARPQNAANWDYYQRYLGYRQGDLSRHTVNAVEYVLLPDWREHRCPWCMEIRLYERWLERQGSMPSALLERLEELSRSNRAGLVDNLFFQFPNSNAFKLGPDSLFAPEHAAQAEVFAATASAIQYLRTNPSGDQPLLGPRRFPISTVLAYVDYCRSKWTDSILRASILRAASVDELTYADGGLEGDRTAAILDLIRQSADGEHEIALELLLAANQEKWSFDQSAELRDQLRGYGAPDVVDFMLDRLADLEPRR